jgi:6-phosphogluconolactonase (cycloisomerase 2 family)
MKWLQKFFNVLTLGILLNLVVGVAPSFANAVTYQESHTHNVNGVLGINGISDVAVSPDGKFVYTASYLASAVSVFERDLDTGQLTYRSTRTGLIAAFSVDVSSDNKHVYVASPSGNVVVALSRNLTTGELTVVNSLGSSPTGGFVSVSVSPDAKTVYGVGGSPSGLVVFNRDAGTGAISQLADYADNVNGNALGQLFSPTGSPIKNIASSADGNFVYVTSTTDHAVSVFSRNTTTGALTLVAVYKDNTDSVDGLQAASSAKISPDGKHLYVTGQGESSVAIFSINSTSGELTYLAKVTHGAGGVTNMQGARSLAISPDGKYVLVSAITSSSVTAFLRDSTTGLLTFDSEVVNNVNGVTNFSAPSGMSTDPLNRHLYVAAQGSNSLVVFALPTPAVRLSVTSQSAAVSGSAVVLDSQLAVLDSDSPNLVSAQVSISSGLIATDTLAVQTVAGIAASYDSSTGVLSLSGVASLADYQSVLRSLTYQAGADPTLNTGDTSKRTISFMVSDGENSSAVSSIVVTVVKADLFTVNFVDWDNAVLSTQQVGAGAAAVAPTSPVRTGYSFTGWSVPFNNISSALTVQAQYSINSYTLTFDSAGGSAVAPISANFGTAVTAPANPTRDGYSFAGWTPSVPTTMPATNTTFTAQWTVISSFTITFDSAGGSAVAPISGNFGAAITAPAAPTREGYSFAGWSPAVPATMPAANTTVTAQWTANVYTITFNTAGGSAVAPINGNFGAAVTAPAAPTREGYSFAGWNPTVPTTMPAANTTVTAQWTVNSYTITFNSAGGSAVAPISANFGAAIKAPADPTREGYSFAGWSPSLPATMPAANTTVTAQWTANSYTITFNSAGGSAVAPISANFGAAIKTPVDPTREGYTFAGWNPSLPATMPAANTTVTAQWTVNSYTITFDSAGGSAVAPISANFGAAITAPANPTREGYTFTRWEPAIPATMPAQNPKLTALYEQIQLTVTATVTGNATISPATQQVNYGSTATVELSLVNADDIVVLAGTCEAAVSGTKIQTSVIKRACTIAVTVYPFTLVEKDSDAALASNGTSRFRFSGGAGAKTLLGASVVRSGVESELKLADAEALLKVQDDGSYIFSARRTGRYTLEFVDAVSGELVKVLYNVFPYLAFTSSQQPVQQDVATTVRVWLSDEPVDYPVNAAVLKDGVTSELQQVQFTAEHKLLRTYTVTATANLARLVLQETGMSNALLGTPAVHNLALQQEVPALALTVKAIQNNAETYVVTQTSGLVNLSVSELNATEANYSWSASGLTLQVSGATASFDPASLAEGRYTITVAGQSANGRTGQYDLALRVIAGCPVESCAGAGTSGIPAAENSFADTPNRLPLCPNVTEENRVGSCQAAGAQALYAEVPNQYQLTLGALTEEQSWSTGQFGMALSDESLKDSGFVQQGLVINFDVLGLENPGEVVPVAIPLPAGTSIPANAIWRKFINGQWQNFEVNTANRIDSAARDILGQCPGVSSDNWSSGLTAGHGCVRLTIQDGGPNDDDGVANSVIRDPGVLAVAEVVVLPPPLPVPPKDVTAKSGGSMGGMMSLLFAAVAAFRIRKSLVAVAAILPLSLSAQPLYLGADLMSVNSDADSAEITQAMNSAGIAGTAVVDNKSRAGYRFYGGYQFAETLSIELGWLDAGEITTLFSGVAPGTEASDLEAVWPISGNGIELSLLWQPVTTAEWFKPGLRLGVWQMEVQDKFVDAALLSRQNQNETVAFVEVQGQIKLTDHWSLKLGASYYDVGTADMRTAQLGLIRHF